MYNSTIARDVSSCTLKLSAHAGWLLHLRLEELEFGLSISVLVIEAFWSNRTYVKYGIYIYVPKMKYRYVTK